MAQKARSNSNGIRGPYDIIAIDLVLIAAVLVSIYFPGSLPAIILAVPAVFFIPGHAIVSALLPRGDEVAAPSFLYKLDDNVKRITAIERVVLAVVISIATVGLVGSLLSRGPFGLTSLNVIIGVAVLTFIPSGIAIFRRYQFAGGVRPEARPLKHRPKERWTGAEKIVALIVVASAVVMVIVAVQNITASPSVESYTEFYILGTNGTLEGLPSSVSASQSFSFDLIVANHENEPMNYTLTISTDNIGNYTSTSGFNLGQTVTLPASVGKTVTFTVQNGRELNTTISAIITKSGSYTVYLILHSASGSLELWMPISVS